MQIPRLQFYKGFVQRADAERSPSLAFTSESPRESVVLSKGASIIEASSDHSAELQQAREAAKKVALELSPSAAVQIALAVALEVTPQALDNEDAEKFLRSVAPTRSLSQQSELAAAFEKMKPNLKAELPTPVLSEDLSFGEGAHAGSQVVLNPVLLDEPNLADFVLGHELGHAELRHGVQRAALKELSQLLPTTDENRRILRKANQELELQADARAADLSAPLGIDPLPVLKTLLKSREDEDHPPGPERAEALREHLAQNGITVSPDQWQTLFEQTATIRAQIAEDSRREEAFLEALKKFV